MKILQICPNKRGMKNRQGVVNGGLEKVMVDVHELLLENNFDAYIIDSYSSSYDFKNVIKVDTNCSTLKLNDKLENIATQYEVIILHGHNSLAKRLTKKGIKFIHIDHQPHSSVNKFYHQDIFGDTYNNSRGISKYYTVSDATKIMKEEVIRKNINKDFSFDGVIKFQFVTSELDVEYDGIFDDYIVTVGRPSPEKAPHRIKKFTEYKIITQIKDEPDKKEQDYFDKYLYNDNNVMINLKRDEILTLMQKAKYYYSTCSVESAGITAFESLCFGVPVILNENKMHSSRMFLPEEYHYFFIQDKQPLTVYTKEERKLLSNVAKEYNSKENFIQSFKNMIYGMENIIKNTPDW